MPIEASIPASQFQNFSLNVCLTFKYRSRVIRVPRSIHRNTKSLQAVLVALLIEPLPDWESGVERFRECRFMWFLREGKFGIKEDVL